MTKSYILSFIAGLLVGILYAAIRIKSPAPPIVALIGLLGIVVGEAVWPLAWQIIHSKW